MNNKINICTERRLILCAGDKEEKRKFLETVKKQIDSLLHQENAQRSEDGT